jgi:hypothetical protein
MTTEAQFICSHPLACKWAQATPGKAANALQDTQQTPQDEVSQLDNILNEVEESIECLSCSEFNFDFICACIASTERGSVQALSI